MWPVAPLLGGAVIQRDGNEGDRVGNVGPDSAPALL